MAGRLTGKVVLLTGATQGIGKALALALARERARLVLAARSEEALVEVATMCRSLGADAIPVLADVGVEADCQRLVTRCRETFQQLDVLLLNAGQDMISRLDELQDRSVLERLIRVNYLGCAWLTHEALPDLKRSRGRIVVVSSLAGLTGVPTRTGYAASKHALHGFFDSLRIELQGTGVTITLVCPDFVRSEIHRRAWGPDGKPLGKSPLVENRIQPAEACALAILQAARKRKRLVLLSWRGRLGYWMRWVAPGVVDWLAARAVARGY